MVMVRVATRSCALNSDKLVSGMSIGNRAARGIAWNMVLGIASRVFQLVGTLILTRFIAPDEYGAVLAASITVATAGTFTTLAFGQFLIARRASAEVAIQAMAVHVLLGVLAMVAIYPLRGALGDMVDTPTMGQYLLGYAIAHIIDRARYVPERLLVRALRFRMLATINGIGDIMLTVTAISTASRFGAYAVVFGTLVKSVVTAILFFALAPRAEWLTRLRFRIADLRTLFGYGLPILIGSITDRAATRWDNLIISRLFSAAVMGRYNLAFSLAEMPGVTVAETIGDVLMPSLAQMEDAQRKRAVVRAAEMMGLVIAPLGVGLAALSGTLVATFFDARWASMAPMLAILCSMSVVRPMIMALVSYLEVTERTRFIMIASFVRAILCLALVALGGVYGGPLWACAGACVGYAGHTVFMIVGATAIGGISTGAYFRAVLRPLLPCVPMAAAVLGAASVLEQWSTPHVVMLLAEVVVGMVVYILSAFVLVHTAARELLRVGLAVIKRRRDAGSSE